MERQLSFFDLDSSSIPSPHPLSSNRPLRNAPMDRELDAAMERYASRAHAERTRAIYRGDWLRFKQWCEGCGVQHFPASPKTLARYLTALAELGRRPSTIHRARIAICKAHAFAGLPRPDADERTRLVEKGIRRTLGTAERRAHALMPNQLCAMARSLGRGTRAERDRALLLIGYAGGFRRSELMAMRLEHLRFVEGGLSIFLPRGKADQEGKGAHVHIPHGGNPSSCPVVAMKEWADRLADTHGPIFVRIRDGLPTEITLSDQTVSRVVTRAARLAGLQGHFSAHSLRAGFATAAHLSGQKDLDIQAHGRWESKLSLDRYIHGTRSVKVL